MIRFLSILVVLVTLNVNVNSASTFAELNLKGIDFDSERNKPVDKYFSEFLNFLDVKLVENVIKNIDQIKQVLNSEKFVLKTAIESVRLFRVSSSSLENLLDESIDWIEKRLFVVGRLYNGKGYTFIYNKMIGIKSSIKKIKSSIESYRTDIQSLSKIVNGFSGTRFLDDVIEAEEIDSQVKDRIIRINNKSLTIKFNSIRDSLSELIQCLNQEVDSIHEEETNRNGNGVEVFLDSNQGNDFIEDEGNSIKRSNSYIKIFKSFSCGLIKK